MTPFERESQNYIRLIRKDIQETEEMVGFVENHLEVENYSEAGFLACNARNRTSAIRDHCNRLKTLIQLKEKEKNVCTLP
jgi:hypothetical protein